MPNRNAELVAAMTAWVRDPLNSDEELTYQEIADQMEISIKTVENQMGKALKVLRAKLQNYLSLLLLLLGGWW